MNSVQGRSFFWSVFSRIRTEYGEVLVFGHFSRSGACSESLGIAQLLPIDEPYVDLVKDFQKRGWGQVRQLNSSRTNGSALCQCQGLNAN